MAKISSFKRISVESVSDENQELVDVIGTPVNDFASEVINAFNKNLSVDDNLKMDYKEIELTLTTGNIPINTTQYKISFSGRLRGIIIIKVENLTSPTTYPPNAPFVSFLQDNNIITIKHITGLDINNKYRLTLLSLG